MKNPQGRFQRVLHGILWVNWLLTSACAVGQHTVPSSATKVGCIDTAYTYYPSGKLESKVITDENGTICDTSYAYCENGTLRSKMAYSQYGSHALRIFHCNGQTAVSGTYVSNPGCLIGSYQEFDESGRLTVQGEYRMAERCQEANIKVGTWSYFADGKLLRTENP